MRVYNKDYLLRLSVGSQGFHKAVYGSINWKVLQMFVWIVYSRSQKVGTSLSSCP